MAEQDVKQTFLDAILDADSLEQFINGSEDETVLTRLSAEYPTLQNAIKQLFENGGLPATPFKTKALMEASELADGSYAQVTDAGGDNGLYLKESGTWVKSAYDPVRQVTDYINQNPLVNPVVLESGANLNDITESGVYVGRYQSVDMSTQNFPTESGLGVLYVSTADGTSNIYQVFIQIGGDLYVRRNVTDSWGEWASTTHRADVASRLNTERVGKLEHFNNDAFTSSTNIFNGAVPNTTIDYEGNIIYDQYTWLSDFIAVNPGEALSVPERSYRIFNFNADKEFIARSGTVGSSITVNPDSNVRYIRLSSSTPLDEMQVNRGGDLLDYEPYYIDLAHPKPDEDIIITPKDTTFFELSPNLLDKSSFLDGKSVDINGVVITDESRWLSDYIPVSKGEELTITDGAYRFAYYDKNKGFLTRTGVSVNSDRVFSVPNVDGFALLRVSGTTSFRDVSQVVRGEVMPEYQPYGEYKILKKYLPDIQSSIDVDLLRQEIENSLPISTYEPSEPTLTFTLLEDTWREPLWLSADGEVIWGVYGKLLLQSEDDWVTRTQVGLPLPTAGNVAAVRELDDGELLVATSRNEDEGEVSKLFKTIGYDRNNPSATTFKEVLAIGSTQANITNTWGLSVYQNIVTASEYGLRGAEGAKHVYLSEDYGDTFRLIFNQHTVVANGRPPLTETAHVHTAAYDPYYERIWVVCGDSPNTATYYSDDRGGTWKFVTGSSGDDAVQYTGILALPNAVIFGSDRAPNGVHVYHRNGKDKMPKITLLEPVNDEPKITHVFGLPYKKGWGPTEPVYFCGNSASGRNAKPHIVGTVDGKTANILWTGEVNETIKLAIGSTKSGKVILVSQSDSTNALAVRVANAPSWARV